MEPFASILNRLNAFADQPVYEVPFLGNSGDELIRIALRKLMEAENVVPVVSPDEASLMIWPGGNFCMWLPHLRLFDQLMRENPDAKIIMGPGTYRKSALDWEHLFHRYSNRIDAVFARDSDSFDYLHAAFPNRSFDVELCPDLAIGLHDAPSITEYHDVETDGYRLVAIRNDHESVIAAHGLFDKAVAWVPIAKVRFLTTYVLARLASKQRIRHITQEIERECGSSLRSEVVDISLLSLDEFLSTIGRADEVHTDRLHVMLASLMMRKKTYAYPTRFGKLEGALDVCRPYLGVHLCDKVTII